MIDNRHIKCSCSNPECKIGISFDTGDDRLFIFRMHDKHGNECAMSLDKKTAQELIDGLRDYKKQLKK